MNLVVAGAPDEMQSKLINQLFLNNLYYCIMYSRDKFLKFSMRSMTQLNKIKGLL